MHTLLTTLALTITSFFVCNLFTHPKSKIWNNYFPELKFKRIELLPSLRIKVKGKVIHFHHWFNFGILLIISIFYSPGILASWDARGIIAGVVLQGLSTPSARKIVYKEDWLRKMLSK